MVRVEVGEHHVGDVAGSDPEGAEVGQEGATREPVRRLGAVPQIDQDEPVPAADEKAPDRHVQPPVVAQQRRVLRPVDLARPLGRTPGAGGRLPQRDRVDDANGVDHLGDLDRSDAHHVLPDAVADGRRSRPRRASVGSRP